MELYVNHCNINLEKGTVVITGYDEAEIVGEVGAYNLLRAMDYEDITNFVAEIEEEKRELAELAREDK